MTRTDIEKALRRQTTGDFVSRAEIARALGYKDPHRIDRFLRGLNRIGYRYFVTDVAERLLESI